MLLKSVQGLYPQDLPLRVALVMKTLDLSRNQQPRDQELMLSPQRCWLPTSCSSTACSHYYAGYESGLLFLMLE